MRTKNGRDGTPQQGTCFLCNTVCGKDEFCYGCHVFICKACTNVDEDVEGPHVPEQHVRRNIVSDAPFGA